MNKENVFYVYIHRRKTDNKVFYVGKGKGNRAYTVSGRNERWTRTYKKHGMTVEIVFDSLAEDEAYAVEKDTILEMIYFGYPLCNMTEGGDGIRGLSLESRQKLSRARKDKRMYTFTDEFGRYFTGTRPEICEFYQIKNYVMQSCITKKTKCNGLGMVQDGESLYQAISRLFPKLSGIESKRSIKDIITLVNKDGNVITGIRVQIAENMGWNLASFGGFVKGCSNNKTFKGYALVIENETKEEAILRAFNNLNYDNNIYTFLDINSMQRITCTRKDLRELKNVFLKQLFNDRNVEQGYALVLDNESDCDVLKRISPNRQGNKDDKIYEFVNVNTNETFVGDRCSFSKHTKSDSNKYKALFYSRPYKIVNGWKLKVKVDNDQN